MLVVVAVVAVSSMVASEAVVLWVLVVGSWMGLLVLVALTSELESFMAAEMDDSEGGVEDGVRSGLAASSAATLSVVVTVLVSMVTLAG